MHPTTRHLERLPPEIWHDILSYACTDGGATGRALALTSRFFHEQSHECRLHSVQFRTITRSAIFLRSHRDPRECKIRNFFYKPHLSDIERHIALEDLTIARQGLFQSLLHNQDIRDGRGTAAVLALAARHLRTLSIAYHKLSTPIPLFQHFPKLQELSVWNHPLAEHPVLDSLLLGGESIEANVHRPLCPSLKRLHVILTDSDMSFQTILRRLPDLASTSLTHLRLSGVTYTEDALSDVLAAMLGVPAPLPLRERIRAPGDAASRAGPVVPDGATFPNLRFLVISAVQPRFDEEAGPEVARKWTGMLGLLRELERTCKRVRGMRMVVLERSWMRKPVWGVRMQRDWEDRMLGGPGCWVVSEAEESKIEGPVDSPKGVEW
ncbi:uncharacterized protein BXZ73DRAFT_90787 [Epithele typhae]|uniref:uncharacterized protein n=1 Tax=Epithele typhae TaxID=378194 RepID=UPI0020080668|nr:uncharacterized protein BXZ73DRAFT_90787 [Epithele typhae]KAH9927085.1 hypothetical protein BXZ73DRAFT_90787 [Epithele typhae]